MPLSLSMQRAFDFRTNARQLAVARMIVGVNAALAALEAWRTLSRLLRPAMVRIPFVSWIPRLPADALGGFIALWLVSALLFVLGWKTRVAGTLLVLVTSYTLFLDQQTYSNHLYLLVLVLLLLTVADSGAAWSLDARGSGERSEVAGWPVLLLKIEISIVYFFSAAAKISPRYLSGEILALSLKEEGWSALPSAWRSPAVITLLAVSSIVAELFIAFGLWSPRLRPFAILTGVGFHLLILAIVDSSRLSLSIFALDMFAGYLLFADEDLLRRLKSGARIRAAA